MNFNLFQLLKITFCKDKSLRNSIKNIFGFYPKNIFIYELAFRHKSVSKEIVKGKKINNERLEYLGDAILSAVVADYLFKKFPYKEEGFLTIMRSKIVSRDSLNKLSQKLGLDNLIMSNNIPHNLYRSIKGNAFEAFIGALYLDKGYNFTKKIIINRIIKHHFDIDKLETEELNFKSKLIEWAQKEKKFIEFKVIDEIVNNHIKQYLIEVFIENKSFAKAQDFSIKGAEKIAAEKAYNKLNPKN